MIDQDLAATVETLARLEQQATPTPWVSSHDYMRCPDGLCPEVNAELIAASRNALPALLEAARQLIQIRGMVTDLQSHVEALRKHKTCEDEPTRCYQDSGPMCDAHDFADMYTPTMRSAADAIANLLAALADPTSEEA